MMNAYLEILRPANAIMAVIAVLLMALISGVYDFNIFLAGFLVFIATGGGNVINDYFDYNIDKINKPERPIPSGRISRKNAYYYSISLFIISSILGFYINVNAGLIAVFSSILMFLYASKLKKAGLIGNFVVSFLTGLTFILGGFVVEQYSYSVDYVVLSGYLAFYAFLMTFSREIIKDMEDLEGDKLEGSNSFPIKYGKKISSILAAILILLAVITSPILYFNGLFGIYYLFILSIAILIFVYCAYKILIDQSPENCAKVSKLIKIAMFIAFISFAFGTFRGL